METASMFGRKRSETEDRKMSDAPDDLGIPQKPARNNSGQNAPGQSATVAPLGRAASPPPVAARPTGAKTVFWPGALGPELLRAGFVGMPRSSGASDILRSSVSDLFRPNMEAVSIKLRANCGTARGGTGWLAVFRS